MATGKRKRSGGRTLKRQKAKFMGSKLYTPRSERSTSVTPGRTRIGGFYGRYAPAGSEMKFHDVAVNGAIATGGLIVPSLNLIAQGTTESKRIGRKCVIRKIGWKWMVLNAHTVSRHDDTIRLIVYLDKQTNGAAAGVTDILETANYQSFRNLANSQRFKILLDDTFDSHTMAGAYTGTTDTFPNVQISGDFYKDCNIPIEFNNTTGEITEIRSNNLGILLISRIGNCSLDSQVRIRFSDS